MFVRIVAEHGVSASSLQSSFYLGVLFPPEMQVFLESTCSVPLGT